MKNKPFIIALILLLVSLTINAVFIFHTTPKPMGKVHSYALYQAEFKVVDNETGEPIKLFSVKTPSTTSYYSEKGLKPFKETVVKSMTILGINILDGYGCIVWMKDIDTPCEFAIGAVGYQEVPLPKEIITEVECIRVSMMGTENQIRLKKAPPNGQG